MDETQMNKILDLIKNGQSQGAKMTTGGKRYGDKGEPAFVHPYLCGAKIVFITVYVCACVCVRARALCVCACLRVRMR